MKMRIAHFYKKTFLNNSKNMKRKEGNKMNIFKAVKENVTPMEAAWLYGLNINKHGMCTCPFHNDKHPSMKVDKEAGKGFYCFGCQEHGDVIDLVTKLQGVSNYTAAKMLANDFKIPYDASKDETPIILSEKEKEHIRKRQEAKAFAKKKRDLCQFILTLMSQMREEKFLAEEKAMKVLEDNEIYNWVIGKLDCIEDKYDYILDHTDEELQEVIDEIEKGVFGYAKEFTEIRNGSKRAS